MAYAVAQIMMGGAIGPDKVGRKVRDGTIRVSRGTRPLGRCRLRLEDQVKEDLNQDEREGSGKEF